MKLICSHCGQHVPASNIHEVCEREVRDLPCFEYRTTVAVETYRVKCPHCGIRAENLPPRTPALNLKTQWTASFYVGESIRPVEAPLDWLPFKS